MTRIVHAASGVEIEAVRGLFAEYAAGLDLDLGFQAFHAELAALPGDYTPPRGSLLLAIDDQHALGCVGLRPLDWPEVAELKRLYVRPEGRGRHLGTLLSAAALLAARDIGYRRVRLDTLATMAGARHLYESLGFRQIAAYRFNPLPGARYLELELGSSDARA
jgi:ribosomal protein S18 acetylase RimI-like enzyme